MGSSSRSIFIIKLLSLSWKISLHLQRLTLFSFPSLPTWLVWATKEGTSAACLSSLMAYLPQYSFWLGYSSHHFPETVKIPQRWQKSFDHGEQEIKRATIIPLGPFYGVFERRDSVRRINTGSVLLTWEVPFQHFSCGHSRSTVTIRKAPFPRLKFPSEFLCILSLLRVGW